MRFHPMTPAIVMFALVAACLLPIAAAAQDDAPAPRPNIVFILADDLRHDTLGYAGNDIIQTPHIDALAARGTRFTNAYVTTPICCTSRASFFTGQYASQHGIHQFNQPLSEEQWAQTYPALLHDAGYRSGLVGKFGVAGHERYRDSFDYWFEHQGRYEHEDEDGNPIHLTALLGNRAVDFLETCDADQPFLLSLHFKAPHVQDNDPRQFIPDPNLMHLYEGVEIPPPVGHEERRFEDLPDLLSSEDYEGRRRWRLRFADDAQRQESVRNYYRLITGIDNVVGRVVAQLETQGLLGNTVIIFTSDHGFFLGEWGLAGKWLGYDDSIRIPLVIADPRAPEALHGQTRDEMVLNLDLWPTVLNLAGGETPPFSTAGRDLAPLLGGESPRWRGSFWYEHHFEHGSIPQSDGIVGGRYKYLRYYNADPVVEQLFDREADPLEVNNLVDDPGSAELLERVRRRYFLEKHPIE
ncbi:sulfatase [Phycisphaeraceae bacterium D3-23]